MSLSELKHARELITRDFELEPVEEKDPLTEEDLLRELAGRIDYMIEYQFGYISRCIVC